MHAGVNSSYILLKGTRGMVRLFSLFWVEHGNEKSPLTNYQHYILQLTSTGEERTMHGLSLLVDNGYLKFKQMQCPYKEWSSDKEKEWSKMAESLRLYNNL